jgi:hypothetical protein
LTGSYLVTQSKQGISNYEAQARSSHAGAQLEQTLERNVRMDNAYIGGARCGRRGRGATGKTPFVAAIAATDDGEPNQIILRPVKAFSSLRSESSQAPRSSPAPIASPTVWHASPLSPKPDACTAQ